MVSSCMKLVDTSFGGSVRGVVIREDCATVGLGCIGFPVVVEAIQVGLTGRDRDTSRVVVTSLDGAAPTPKVSWL